MRCHNGSYPNAPAVNPTEHGHHKLTDKGGECIGCHMPVTVYMQRHPRHDHGFTIPDPLLTKQLNIPNACGRCHADKSVDWALENTEKWYGAKMNRPTRERAQWIASAQQGEESGRDHLLEILNTGKEPAYWRAVATGLLWQWAVEPKVKSALFTQLKDEHPLVREKAVRSLESLVDAGNEEVLTHVKPMLNDPIRNVRVAAAWVLRSTVEMRSPAAQELQTALNLGADQPVGQYRKATFELARQNPWKAVEHYQKAVQWDAYSPALRSSFAGLLIQLNRPQEAVQQMEILCQQTPNSAEYRFKLGQIQAQTRNFEKAAQSLTQTVKLNPQHGQGWYNLGLAYSALGKTSDALAALAKAESLEPKDAHIPYARAVVLFRNNRFSEARDAAQKALRIQPDFKAAKTLLQNISQNLD